MSVYWDSKWRAKKDIYAKDAALRVASSLVRGCSDIGGWHE